MAPPRRARKRAVAALGLVFLPVLYGGCQALEKHQPSTSYYDHGGMWYGQYDIDPGRARVAVLAALADLHMPVYQEGQLPCGGFLDTRMPEGFEARVLLVPLGPYGQGTRVGVRVGGFGTHPEVCAHILDEIPGQLDAMWRIPPVPGTFAPPPAVGATAPALPPEPIPVK
jgi:hypothetical protein